MFNVSGIEFTGNPGYSYRLVLSTTGIDPDMPSNQAFLQEVSADFELEIELRECKEGEAFTDSGKCQECLAET